MFRNKGIKGLAKPKKIYKNSDGKIIYKQSTDKVGDTLTNQAGVKYKITGERFAAPMGRNDEGVQVRILTITPDKRSGLPPFEVSDGSLEYDRKLGILSRLKSNGKLGREGRSVMKRKNRESKKYTKEAIKSAQKARKDYYKAHPEEKPKCRTKK